MTDNIHFQKLALSFPGTEEHPHFEKKSFRVKKKIWATLNILDHRACLKLSPIDQSVFCAFDKAIIYPASNKWGLHGWTMVELSKIKKAMLKDIAATAYREVAGKNVSKK
jgi:hypothetical protein